MDPNIYTAIGWTLIHSLWQIGLVSLVIYLILNSGWIKSSHRRFNIVVSGIAFIALMASITFTLYFTTHALNSSENDSQLITGLTANHNNHSGIWKMLSTWFDSKMIYFTIAWISGFVVYSIKLLGGLSYLGYIRNTSISISERSILSVFDHLIQNSTNKKSIRILVSEKILSPVTFGLYKVSIVLPIAYINQLNLEDTEVILAHEIAHIMRNDFLINLLASIIKSIFYFHPAIWWLMETLENEREKATDKLACDIGTFDSIQYAKTLVKAQELALKKQNSLRSGIENKRLAIPLFKSRKQLLSRIEHLLGKQTLKNEWAHRFMALVLFFSIFALLSFTQIIIPGSGRNVHPAFEGEVLKQEVSFNTQKESNLPAEDSVEVKMIVKIEKEEEEEEEELDEVSVEVFQQKREPKPKKRNEVIIEENNEVFVVGDSFSDEQFIFDYQNDILLEGKLEQIGNQGHKIERILKLKQDSEELYEFQEEYLTQLEAIENNIPAELIERFNFSHHKMDEPAHLHPETQVFMFKRPFGTDTIIQKWSKHLHTAHEIPVWIEKEKKEFKQHFKDSQVLQYKLDEDLLENLKLEGLNHIEEFRFEHFPVDEHRMMNIIYIEG